MEEQADKAIKRRRGRKALPPELRKRSISAIVSPKLFAKLSADLEKGMAESHGQRIVQILEKFYAQEEKNNPPW
jgi:hypothetical protein